MVDSNIRLIFANGFKQQHSMDTQDRQKILQALNMAYLYVMDADSPLQRVIDEAVDTLKKYEND